MPDMKRACKIGIGIAGMSLLATSMSACLGAQSNNSPSNSISQSKFSPTQTKQPTVTPSASFPAIEAATQDKNCADIVNPDALYELDPNLVVGNAATENIGSYSAQVLNLGGSSCVITNLSTGVDIQISIVKLTNKSAHQMQSSIEALEQSSKSYEASIGVKGAYSNDGTVGTAQFMNKDYWVVIAEPMPGGNVNTAKLSNLIYTALQ